MENNDSNIKPQQTGGLKLMTVFIAVLALHVVVIGGLTAYHLMSGGSGDADLVTDKSHKDVKVASDGTVSIDNQSSDPDASQADKSATASTTPADPTATPATPTQPDSTGTSGATTVPTTTTVASSPASTPAPISDAPSGPVITPEQAPAPAPAPVMAAAPEATPESQPDSLIGTPYVVKRNDTLARIAHRTHTSVAKLKAANGLNGEVLHLGEKLLIPAKTEVASLSAPAPASDVVGTTTVLDNSPTPTLPPAPVMPRTVTKMSTASISGHHTYTVVKGDTLIHIAHRFKTTATALMAANNITDPTKLGIGKKLIIPSREARSAAIAAPANAQPSQAKPTATGQLANFVQ